ncbi:MAG: hypothetical protein ACKUBY_03820 [Candidatus Moraniibacteriota bacterium]
MNKQFVDLKMEKSDIEQSLIECGLWDTPEKRRRHNYILSPCAYLVTKQQQEQLLVIAKSVYAAIETLDKVLIEIAKNKPRDRYEQELFSLASRACNGLAKPGVFSAGIPKVMKLDLMQTPKGDFKIAEVDAYNPRGLAFMAILDETVKNLDLEQYSGLKGFAKMLRGQRYEYIYSEKEFYYLPAFEVMQKLLVNYGIDMPLVVESELETRSPKKAVIIPDSLTRCSKDVRANLLDECETFFPPKAYLGAKGFLPFLSNCDGMENFIPKTQLVSKRHEVDIEGASILKATMSSGMKGILFSDLDAEKFAKQLEQCSKAKKASWVLQKQVEQESLELKIFDNLGKIKMKKYYLRITAQITKDGILGLDITGRPDRIVHGAPDCIQLPAILE